MQPNNILLFQHNFAHSKQLNTKPLVHVNKNKLNQGGTIQ